MQHVNLISCHAGECTEHGGALDEIFTYIWNGAGVEQGLCPQLACLTPGETLNPVTQLVLQFRQDMHWNKLME